MNRDDDATGIRVVCEMGCKRAANGPGERLWRSSGSASEQAAEKTFRDGVGAEIVPGLARIGGVTGYFRPFRDEFSVFWSGAASGEDFSSNLLERRPGRKTME